MKRSLSSATFKLYRNRWSYFRSFCKSHDLSSALPVPASIISYLVAHLANRKLKVSSIRTYLSAVSFKHKMKGYKDECSGILVKQLLKGIKNQSKFPSQRAPITEQILNKLIEKTSESCQDHYEQALIRALFLLCFHACLRGGEIVLSVNRTHVLKYKDVQIEGSGENKKLIMKLQSFKFSREPSTVIVRRGKPHCYCPIAFVKSYLKIRGNSPGPMFLHSNKAPVTIKEFRGYLKSTLILCNIDPANYNTHSFRIGKATQLSDLNMTDSEIKTVGRWRSNAFRTYLRNNNVLITL